MMKCVECKKPGDCLFFEPCLSTYSNGLHGMNVMSPEWINKLRVGLDNRQTYVDDSAWTTAAATQLLDRLEFLEAEVLRLKGLEEQRRKVQEAAERGFRS